MIINYFKRRRYLFIFFSVLFIIGMITGIVIYLKLDNNIKLNLINNLTNFKEDIINNRLNPINNHIFLLFLSCVLTLTVIGYFYGLFYFFYEGMSISFTSMYLCLNYGLKGLIFSILYNICFKLLFLILFCLVLDKLFNFLSYIICYIFHKKCNITLKKTILSVIILSVFIILNDLIIFFFGNYLVKILIFVL